MARSSRGRQTALGISAIVGFGVISVQAFGATAPQLLSQKPAQSAAAMQFEAQTSTLAPTVEIPYSLVEEAANGAADRFAGPRAGHAHIVCQNVTFGGSLPVKVTLFKGCADFDWNVTASRNGNIVVKRAGDGITLDMPVKFTGSGNFTGQLAKAIRTPDQTFSGTFVVSASGQVTLDKSFCPRVEKATAHFKWGTPPDIKIIGRSCLDVGHGLNACVGPWKFPAAAIMTEQINRSLEDQIGEINNRIPCNAIREPLQQAWKNWSFPVPMMSPPVYVTIQPKDLSVSGITPTDHGLRMTARLDAVTGVTSAAQPTRPLPLPENAPVSGQESRFSIALPVPVPWPVLAAAGSGGVTGKPVRSGKQIITPIEVEVFPVHDQLALGVTLRNDTPGPLRGATGTVWYTATPAIDDEGHAIRLNNVAMTKRTDAPLWREVSGAVLPELGDSLAKSYSYDFSGLLQQARTTLNKTLADPKNTAGLKITIANDDLKIDRTANLPDNFVIDGLFTADVGVALPEAGSRQAQAGSGTVVGAQ